MIRRALTYTFIFLLATSCRKENALDCFKSTGDEISELRYPGNFKEITVADNMEVTVFKGAEYKVEVITGKYIIKNVSTKIEGDILQVQNNNTCNFVRGYKKKNKDKYHNAICEKSDKQWRGSHYIF